MGRQRGEVAKDVVKMVGLEGKLGPRKDHFGLRALARSLCALPSWIWLGKREKTIGRKKNFGGGRDRALDKPDSHPEKNDVLPVLDPAQKTTFSQSREVEGRTTTKKTARKRGARRGSNQKRRERGAGKGK